MTCMTDFLEISLMLVKRDIQSLSEKLCTSFRFYKNSISLNLDDVYCALSGRLVRLYHSRYPLSTTKLDERTVGKNERLPATNRE